MGCPEIARLALFNQDRDIEFVSSDEKVVRPNSPVKQHIHGAPGTSQYVLMRDLVVKVLSKNKYSHDLFAFALGFSAHKYTMDDNIGSIDNYLSEQLINECAPLFSDDDSGNEFAFSLLTGVLVSRENKSGSGLTGLFEDIVLKHALKQETKTVTVNMQTMLADYISMKRLLDSQNADVINTIFLNYIINHLMSEYCQNDERLYEYIYNLVLRLSLLKFLIYLTLARRFDALKDVNEILASLEDTVIEVVTRFSRALGNLKGFFGQTYKDLEAQNATGIAQLAALVKF